MRLTGCHLFHLRGVFRYQWCCFFGECLQPTIYKEKNITHIFGRFDKHHCANSKTTRNFDLLNHLYLSVSLRFFKCFIDQQMLATNNFKLFVHAKFTKPIGSMNWTLKIPKQPFHDCYGTLCIQKWKNRDCPKNYNIFLP